MEQLLKGDTQDYLDNLKVAYNQLKKVDKFTFSDITEAIDELETDNSNRQSMIDFVSSQTNYKQSFKCFSNEASFATQTYDCGENTFNMLDASQIDEE
jgi:hypothetical protein